MCGHHLYTVGIVGDPGTASFVATDDGARRLVEWLNRRRVERA
jgi:hypothetical protein